RSSPLDISTFSLHDALPIYPVVAPFSQQIASAMGVAFPPPPSAIISYMLDRRLDFDPGARFAYSNFGFLVLGRIIEKVSGQTYRSEEHTSELQSLTNLVCRL